MEKNIKKIPAKMRVAIIVSAIWFVLFLILALGDIGARRSETTTFLIIAIIPLLIGWGIWWVRIEFPKNQRKEQEPENKSNEQRSAEIKYQSEKQEPVDVTYQSKKQKPTDVKKSSFGVLDCWLMVSIIVSVIIIGYSFYYKGLDFYSVLALSIEWIIMSVFLTFFWGSIYGAIVIRYGKKNWKNIYWGTACIMSFVSACVIFAKPIEKIEHIPEVQKSFWGITLDSSKSDIISMKGNPSEIEKEGYWVYRIESTDSKESVYVINFEEDKVRYVIYIGTHRSDSLEIQGIKLFDKVQKVRNNFGEPSYVITSPDKLERAFVYEKFHIFFSFKKDKLMLYGIFNPKLKKLRFKFKEK